MGFEPIFYELLAVIGLVFFAVLFGVFYAARMFLILYLLEHLRVLLLNLTT